MDTDEAIGSKELGNNSNDKNPNSRTKENNVWAQMGHGFGNGAENSTQNSNYKEAGEELAPSGPIGLDIGTSSIVASYYKDKDVKTLMQLNAFFAIPYSSITKQTLLRDKIPFFQKDEKIYALGYDAEEFARMLGDEKRRTIESGILNSKEEEAVDVIKALISSVLKNPSKKGEKICFSVPGKPIDGQASVVYHESIIRRHLQGLGYSPMPINEGLAVILSELSDKNYTGIGISMGGGMCNVCFSYLSVPVVTYSIQKGGDYIDAMVADSVGESPARVRMIKEQDFDLSAEPKNRIETGLHIFYDDLFSRLLESLQQVLGSSDNLPRISRPLPLVLSGGTVLPKGARKMFMKDLQEVRLPFKVSDIFITENPLYATSKGALVMAEAEETET